MVPDNKISTLTRTLKFGLQESLLTLGQYLLITDRAVLFFFLVPKGRLCSSFNIPVQSTYFQAGCWKFPVDNQARLLWSSITDYQGKAQDQTFNFR